MRLSVRPDELPGVGTSPLVSVGQILAGYDHLKVFIRHERFRQGLIQL
jgi:hypothetical protein